MFFDVRKFRELVVSQLLTKRASRMSSKVEKVARVVKMRERKSFSLGTLIC